MYIIYNQTVVLVGVTVSVTGVAVNKVVVAMTGVAVSMTGVIVCVTGVCVTGVGVVVAVRCNRSRFCCDFLCCRPISTAGRTVREQQALAWRL